MKFTRSGFGFTQSRYSSELERENAAADAAVIERPEELLTLRGPKES
jgi:hypothetical protein